MKDHIRVHTDFAIDMSEEVVIASLPNVRYERAIDRFIGNEAIDINKFTQRLPLS